MNKDCPCLQSFVYAAGSAAQQGLQSLPGRLNALLRHFFQAERCTAVTSSHPIPASVKLAQACLRGTASRAASAEYIYAARVVS